jgi:hypothetical protein
LCHRPPDARAIFAAIDSLLLAKGMVVMTSDEMRQYLNFVMSLDGGRDDASECSFVSDLTSDLAQLSWGSSHQKLGNFSPSSSFALDGYDGDDILLRQL